MIKQITLIHSALKYILSGLIIAGCLSLNGQTQTGLFYYPLKQTKYPNARMVGLIENKQTLILCSRLSDEQYKVHNLLLQLVDLKTFKATEKNVLISDLSDISNFQSLSDTLFLISGNKYLNKLYEPFQSIISINGAVIKNYADNVVFSTHFNDAVSDGKQWNYQLLTKESKDDQYNISLRKVSLRDNTSDWVKKISSEQNEEGEKILYLADNSILILGRKYNDDKSDYVPILYKISAQGDIMWKKAIDVPGSFFTQSMSIGPDNTIIYMCGYTKNPTGISETRINKLTAAGEPISNSTLADFSGNGLLVLKNGQIFIYGSRFLVSEKQVVTKGKFVITDDNLVEKLSSSLDKTDKPDIDLKKMPTTSSDFLTAVELTDGRIVIGGRVYMPNPENPNLKQNNPLLLVVKPDGTYTK